MTTTEERTVTTQVYRVYIKATPQAIWDAITSPEWTDRYGYGGTIDGALQTGAPYQILAGEGMQAAGVSGPIIDGELIEVDPPRKLVQTWRMLMDPELEAEGFTRLTWEIEEGKSGATRLTVIHELEGAPKLADMLAGAGMQAAGVSGPIIDGELIEVDPPRKLVQTWRMLMDPELEAEGFTRLTWEIQEGAGGVSRLTVIHELEGAPKLATMVSGALEDTGAGGGWSWILSDLKSLLETGSTMEWQQGNQS
jgi:uncharacterized protein YndB with AHSA1/START domain